MQKLNYELEVLVDGNRIKEYIHDGNVYVEGKENSPFSLRLTNNSWERKLFVPTIDGLSVMDGETASYSSRGYIVDPYSAVRVDGWRKSDSNVAEFFFSGMDKSYSKRLGKGTKNLGVIGVAVFSEKKKPIPIVRFHIDDDIKMGWDFGSERGSNTVVRCLSTSNFGGASLSAFSAQLGTGFGDNKRSEVIAVSYDRQDSPECVLELFYNSRKELEKMGVQLNREPVYVSPQSFPGQKYCKDPDN